MRSLQIKTVLFTFRIYAMRQKFYKSQSTARIMETSSAGNPTVSNTIIIVTKPALGIPAAPIDAAVAVIL